MTLFILSRVKTLNLASFGKGSPITAFHKIKLFLPVPVVISLFIVINKLLGIVKSVPWPVFQLIALKAIALGKLHINISPRCQWR